jgi:hypothetical protein
MMDDDQMRARQRGYVMFGNDPASVGGTERKRCVTDPEFADQVAAMWAGIDEAGKATAFLSGVRFAQGYVEHGSQLFNVDASDLLFEEAQEDADAMIYRAARKLPQAIRDSLANPLRVTK